jgi:transposase
MAARSNGLTDSQWDEVKHLFPIERKRKHHLRTVVNAILWLLRTGSQWRNLDTKCPNWEIVYFYFTKWGRDGTLSSLNDYLNCLERLQWEKTEVLPNRWTDKRQKYPRLKKILVDAACKGAFAELTARVLGIEAAIASKPESTKGFIPIKKRWVVERTFGWCNFFRRLVKDDEGKPENAASWLFWANSFLILNRMEYWAE